MSDLEEIWKDVPGYEGSYKVSSLGNIRSISRLVKSKSNSTRFLRGRILKPKVGTNGYYNVELYKEGKGKWYTIHQLVAQSFLNHKIDNYTKVVNHIDHNRLNNNVKNLEVTTARENTNKKHIKSSSDYVGVNFNKARGKWIARIMVKGVSKYLGGYDNEYDAHIAYQKELRNLENE